MALVDFILWFEVGVVGMDVCNERKACDEREWVKMNGLVVGYMMLEAEDKLYLYTKLVHSRLSS